ncbi:hypothetical protein KIPB_016727, partial [Kipferlia bialata]
VGSHDVAAYCDFILSIVNHLVCKTEDRGVVWRSFSTINPIDQPPGKGLPATAEDDFFLTDASIVMIGPQ